MLEDDEGQEALEEDEEEKIVALDCACVKREDIHCISASLS